MSTYGDEEMDSEYNFPESESNSNRDEESQISHWDFRIFQEKDGYFSIGEVYYDAENNPIAWTGEGISPGGEDVEELILCLRSMLNSIKKPVFRPEEI